MFRTGNPRRGLAEAVASALAAAISVPALAADGVIEINQAKAQVGEVTPGDLPGFPVTISQLGSYRLTSNLDVRAEPEPEKRIAIEVIVDNVTVDLNGFSIVGPTNCGESGTAISCSPMGDGDGILAHRKRNLAVKNGVVSGMGRHGIRCDRGCTAESVRLEHNGSDGIQFNNGDGWVKDCVAYRNGAEGIRASGLIRHNTSRENGGTGIFSQPGSVVIGNVVDDNEGNGIRCFSCTLLDNAVTSNDGFGLELGAAAGYGRNVLQSNALGHTTGSGLQVDVNSCGGVACP